MMSHALPFYLWRSAIRELGKAVTYRRRLSARSAGEQSYSAYCLI